MLFQNVVTYQTFLEFRKSTEIYHITVVKQFLLDPSNLTQTGSAHKFIKKRNLSKYFSVPVGIESLNPSQRLNA